MAKRKRKPAARRQQAAGHQPATGHQQNSVVRGLISPRRPVPPHIELPPYAISGQPPPSPPNASHRSTPTEIAAMRQTGAMAAEVLLEVSELVAPGVTTDALDSFAHEAIVGRNAYPSPLNYKGFPKSVCTSVNEVICHGIPDSRPLREGDIINIDVTVYHNGVHGDTSAMFLVGQVDADSHRLVRETLVALQRAVAVVGPGCQVFEIGRAIEQHARRHKLGLVREFIGHGVNSQFHTELQIPHYFEPKSTHILQPDTTFTIEPMLTLGPPALHLWDDDWTAVTNSGQRSAQFEHTLLLTPEGVEVLTRTTAGECAHDLTAQAVGAPTFESLFWGSSVCDGEGAVAEGAVAEGAVAEGVVAEAAEASRAGV